MTTPERGQTVEGSERTAEVFGLHSGIQGRQLFSMAASGLLPSFMVDPAHQSLYSPCRAPLGLGSLSLPFRPRRSLAALGNWEPQQVLERENEFCILGASVGLLALNLMSLES